MERSFKRDIIDNKQNRKHKQREARWFACPGQPLEQTLVTILHRRDSSLTSHAARPCPPASILSLQLFRLNGSSPATRRRAWEVLPALTADWTQPCSLMSPPPLQCSITFHPPIHLRAALRGHLSRTRTPDHFAPPLTLLYSSPSTRTRTTPSRNGTEGVSYPR
jgi:hypothetical protein